jgi:hypothetical protein
MKALEEQVGKRHSKKTKWTQEEVEASKNKTQNKN